MGFGPIITAIDAGHYPRSHAPDVCDEDGQPFPCAAMREARKSQAEYARELRHAEAIKTGRLFR